MKSMHYPNFVFKVDSQYRPALVIEASGHIAELSSKGCSISLVPYAVNRYKPVNGGGFFYEECIDIDFVISQIAKLSKGGSAIANMFRQCYPSGHLAICNDLTVQGVTESKTDKNDILKAIDLIDSNGIDTNEREALLCTINNEGIFEMPRLISPNNKYQSFANGIKPLTNNYKVLASGWMSNSLIYKKMLISE